MKNNTTILHTDSIKYFFLSCRHHTNLGEGLWLDKQTIQSYRTENVYQPTIQEKADPALVEIYQKAISGDMSDHKIGTLNTNKLRLVTKRKKAQQKMKKKAKVFYFQY